MSAQVGTIVIPSSGGLVTVNNLGFTPNLILFFSSNCASLDALETDSRFSVGFAALYNKTIYQHVGAGITKQLGASPTQSARDILSTRCVKGYDTTLAADLEVECTAFDSSGFTLNVVIAPSTDRYVSYLAIEAPEIEVGTHALSGVSSSTTIIPTSFRPSAFFGFVQSGPTNITSTLGIAVAPYISASNASAQHGFGLRFQNGTYGTGADRGTAGSSFLYMPSGITTDSFNVTDISDNSISVVNVGAAAASIVWVSLSGIPCALGGFTPPLLSAGNLSIPLAFPPKAILTQHLGNRASIADGADNGIRLGISLADDTGNKIAVLSGSSVLTGVVTNQKSAHFTSSFTAQTSRLTTDHTFSPTPTGFDITPITAPIGNAIAVRYFIAFGEAELNNQGIIDDDMELRPGETHYMTFGHKNAAIPKASWTIQLFKDGQLIQGIEVDMLEQVQKTYTFSFVNDGTDKSIWSLVVYEATAANNKYQQTWLVRKPVTETNAKQIRSRMDGDGGFIGGGNEQ